MTDLSSPEVQSLCKRLQRTTIVTNVLMCAICATAVGITIWAAVTAKQVRADWAQITFFVLIGLIVAYCAVTMAFEIKLRKKFSTHICNMIASAFLDKAEILHAGELASFETFLAGDKLSIMREDCPAVVQIDLSPIKQYTFACVAVLRRVKEFLCVYYSLRTDRPQSVTLCDKVSGKNRNYAYIEGGLPLKKVSNSFYVKSGIINGAA